MFRSITWTLTASAVLFVAGCDQTLPTSPAPPVPPLPSVPPLPNTPVAPAPTPTAAVPDPATPAAETPATPAAAAPTGAAGLTLEAAFETMAKPSRRLEELFDSIQDDASAMAAAPQIAQAGRELAAGMMTFKSTVAALLLAGQDRQVSQFLLHQAERRETPEGNLMDKLERVVNSPQYPLVRSEMNGVLDGMLEAGTSGDRRSLQRIIERKKLRR